MFRLGDFVLSSGVRSAFKIDCDALTDADLDALAYVWAVAADPFGGAEGVPTGGVRFARALGRYATAGPVLVADDVLTTGGSMERQRAGRDAVGAVIFARGPCPPWVRPVFQM